MKQVSIKKPKYIIPLLCLPFIIGIAWLLKDIINTKGEKEGTELVETNDINIDIPDANLEKRGVQTKFEALKNAFNKSSDYSSIQAIEKEDALSEVDDAGSLYSTDEMRAIDSLNQTSRLREKEMLQQQERFQSGSLSEPDRNGEREAPKKSRMQEEMELFKQQMEYMDSLQNPKPKAPPVKKEVKPEEKPLEVLKAENPSASYFNTVGKNEKSSVITAILDEKLKVTVGSRVRIRLLDDVMINEAIVIKGTYLYGNVSAFTAQRVNIIISSMMINNKRMKVDLSIYDYDGQEGLYVPSSAFRDLTKEAGSQMANQNMQFDQQAEGIEQVAYGAIQDAYRSTTQAISKNIKKNKAKLKYNTQVYLVNNKEKE